MSEANEARQAGPLERLVGRARAACTTNEPQVTAALLFTAIDLGGLSARGDMTLPLFLAVAPLWFVIAFLLNLIDPIPPPNAQVQPASGPEKSNG